MLKNKFLVVFLVILILFITCFTTISNASDTTFDFRFDGTDYSFPDFRHSTYIVIFRSTASNPYLYRVISYSEPDFFYLNENNQFVWSVTATGGSFYHISLSTISSDDHYYQYDNYSGKISGSTTYITNGIEIVYSNFDIYDTNDNLVFQAPVLARVVVELEKVEELPNLVMKMMRLMIPVGLIVFSAVLLVYLIQSKKWLHF